MIFALEVLLSERFYEVVSEVGREHLFVRDRGVDVVLRRNSPSDQRRRLLFRGL